VELVPDHPERRACERVARVVVEDLHHTAVHEPDAVPVRRVRRRLAAHGDRACRAL
jgi:hypothetical protein